MLANGQHVETEVVSPRSNLDRSCLWIMVVAIEVWEWYGVLGICGDRLLLALSFFVSMMIDFFEYN